MSHISHTLLLLLAQFASDALRNDRDLVMTAVTGCGPALEFAAERLIDDKEVVLAAVNADREVIKFASDRLRNDIDVVAAATIQVSLIL